MITNCHHIIGKRSNTSIHVARKLIKSLFVAHGVSNTTYNWEKRKNLELPTSLINLFGLPLGGAYP